jgi:phosphatidylserine/phosphatidylglycerophosphate/cardiolipin synthase-like enzyme
MGTKLLPYQRTQMMYERFSFADNFVKLVESYLLFGLSLSAAICAAEADVTELVFSG